MGGILGLWVGCSVISLFELLELGMDFVGLGKQTKYFITDDKMYSFMHINKGNTDNKN